jgi:MerR HTH family regulatory protein
MEPVAWIPAAVCCEHYQIEFSFIRNLHESGLIGMTAQEGGFFLSPGDLPQLEKFIRWHYELSINPEGIEAVAHLLGRINMLQEENRILRNRMQRFDTDGQKEAEPGVEL